jgi:hypothetical protein
MSTYQCLDLQFPPYHNLFKETDLKVEIVKKDFDDVANAISLIDTPIIHLNN